MSQALTSKKFVFENSQFEEYQSPNKLLSRHQYIHNQKKNNFDIHHIFPDDSKLITDEIIPYKIANLENTNIIETKVRKNKDTSNNALKKKNPKINVQNENNNMIIKVYSNKKNKNELNEEVIKCGERVRFESNGKSVQTLCRKNIKDFNDDCYNLDLNETSGNHNALYEIEKFHHHNNDSNQKHIKHNNEGKYILYNNLHNRENQISLPHNQNIIEKNFQINNVIPNLSLAVEDGMNKNKVGGYSRDQIHNKKLNIYDVEENSNLILENQNTKNNENSNLNNTGSQMLQSLRETNMKSQNKKNSQPEVLQQIYDDKSYFALNETDILKLIMDKEMFHKKHEKYRLKKTGQ